MSISTDFASLSILSMLATQYVLLFSSSMAPDDHGPNSAPPISWIHSAACSVGGDQVFHSLVELRPVKLSGHLRIAPLFLMMDFTLLDLS